MRSATSATRSGTQSIERAFRVIRDVAAHHHVGAKLTEIAQRCELDKGTACRLIAGLVRERVIEQRASDRRYLPGQALFELGLAMPAYRAFEDACRQPMERLARRFKGASFVYLRAGADVVCLARHDHVPLISAWAQPGTRRPMPALAAGLAVLAQLPQAHADEIVDAYFEQLSRSGQSNAATRRKMVQRSRKLGFGLNEGDVAPGLHSVAVPIWDAAGTAFASLSMVSLEGPISKERLDEMLGALRKESAQISQSAPRPLDMGSALAAAALTSAADVPMNAAACPAGPGRPRR